MGGGNIHCIHVGAILENDMKLRPELSKKNPLYISKHEFYTAYHYALQYPEWKAKYAEMIGSASKALDYDDMPHGNSVGDPTSRIAMRTYRLKDKIYMVESTARIAGQDLWEHLLYGVTHEGVTFNFLHSDRCPLGKLMCERTKYYDMRRLFYYLLSQRLDDMELKCGTQGTINDDKI